MSDLITKLVLFVVCPVSIVVGSMLLADYSTRPVEGADVLQDLKFLSFSQLPDELKSTQSPQPTLLLFCHPHCPCTMSTLRTLERLHPSFTVTPRLIIYTFCPGNQPENWIKSPLVKVAESLAGTQVVVDLDGEICRKFGVCTSGHALLYDKNGQLLFSGGITPGRGHEGDSLGSKLLKQRVNGESQDMKTFPVFGCLIIDPEETRREL